MSEVVIGSHNAHEHQDWEGPDGIIRAKGLIPRDFSAQPHGSMRAAPPFDIPVIPRNEWASRIKDKIQAKAQMSDIRNKGMNGGPYPARDQNGKGYCWMHSGVGCMIMARAIANEPYADLSAYAGACIIKNYRDEGGNGIDGIEFLASRGIPTSEFWPQQSMSRANDNPATWANATKYKATEWMDLDPNAMEDQFVTCLLLDIPVLQDANWWSHSFEVMDAVDYSANVLTTRILNSWGNSWSDNGAGLLTGSHAIPDNAVALRVATAAA